MAATGLYSIVLLFEDQANSLQVIPSLKEKGLDIHVVANAAELIQIIAAKKFDLVCLSVNHPSASSLVQVLKIKTHVAVLVFGEDQSMDTSRAVLKTVADYQLTGAISSYNIWMKIAHLVKEKQRQAENASRKLIHRQRQDDDENIVVKSSTKPKEKETVEAVGKVSVKSNIKEKSPKLSVVAAEEKITVRSSISEEKITVKSAIPKKEKKILMSAKRKAPKLQINGQEDVEIVSGGKEESVGAVAVVDAKEEVRAQEVEVRNEKPAVKGKLLKMNRGTKPGASAPVKVNAKSAEADNGQVEIKTSSEKEDLGHVSVGSADAPTKTLKPLGKRKQQEKQNKDPLTEEEQIDREIDQLQNLFFENDSSALGLGSTTLEEDDARPVTNNVISMQDKRAERAATVSVKTANAVEEDVVVDNREVPSQDNGQVLVEEVSSYQTEEARLASIEAARAHRKKIKEKKAQKEEAALKIGKKEHLLFKKSFREAVAKAGEHSLQRLENTKTIGVVNRVSLIPVDNISERGFILVANSSNDYASSNEITDFKGTLNAEMQGFEDKHEFSLGDTYNIETLEVDVAAWAERSSQFFYTFEHPETGQQVLICFLKRDDLSPETCHMEEQRMHRIEIHEVPARLPVSFDAYLFLARNDKMLPYLRRGGSLTAKQIQRLYQRGFKFLYVRDEDVRDYYEFYYSFSLNQDFRLVRKFA